MHVLLTVTRMIHDDSSDLLGKDDASQEDKETLEADGGHDCGHGHVVNMLVSADEEEVESTIEVDGIVFN